MIIGTFTKNEDSFTGTIRSPILNFKTVKITPAKGDGDKFPDFHLFAGNVELGAAWQKLSEEGATYYTVKIDDPTFAKPVFARLTEGEDGYSLVWTRAKPKKD